MIVGHAKPTSVSKFCYQICADDRNTSLLTYTYTYNGVSYSGSLEPNTCTIVCADENSVNYNLTGTTTLLSACDSLADCSGDGGGGGGDPTPTPAPTPTEPPEEPGDGETPPTTYSVIWNFNNTSELNNAYVGATSTSTSAITSKTVTSITSGSTATTTVYIVPNTGYVYTLSNQAFVSVSLGTANNSAVTNGAIPVTLSVTNVTSNININVTVSDDNGGAVSTDSGSGSGPTPTPTATEVSSGSGSGTYYYTVECVSGSCTQGVGRPVTWVGEALSPGTLVTLDNQTGCWEVLATTAATPISTVVGLCSTPSATPTPTPTPTETTYTVFKMDPCDGVSPYVYARSTFPVTIGTVYSLSGITYADELYTAIQSLTQTTWDTWVLDPWDNCDGGDAPACLLEGTKVTLHDGTQKNIEELVIGDTLLSKVVLGNPNMPDSDDISVLSQWSSESITLSSELTQITAVTGYPRASVTYINNGLLKASPSHQHIVKKNGVWTVAVTTDLQVGDSLINENGQEILIESLSEVNGSFVVYKIDVEQNDTFIADGIVTHNGKGV